MKVNIIKEELRIANLNNSIPIPVYNFLEKIDAMLKLIPEDSHGSEKIEFRAEICPYDSDSILISCIVSYERNKTDEEIALSRIDAIEDNKRKRRKLLDELDRLDRALTRL